MPTSQLVVHHAQHRRTSQQAEAQTHCPPSSSGGAGAGGTGFPRDSGAPHRWLCDAACTVYRVQSSNAHECPHNESAKALCNYHIVENRKEKGVFPLPGLTVQTSLHIRTKHETVYPALSNDRALPTVPWLPRYQGKGVKCSPGAQLEQ